MARQSDDHDQQLTGELKAQDVDNALAHLAIVDEQLEKRLRQASRYRTGLFYGAAGLLVLLVLLTLDIIVCTVFFNVMLSTGVLTVIIGGLTAQVVSIVLVISRSASQVPRRTSKLGGKTRSPKRDATLFTESPLVWAPIERVGRVLLGDEERLSPYLPAWCMFNTKTRC